MSVQEAHGATVATAALSVAKGGIRLFRLSRPEEAVLMMPLLRAVHQESPFGAMEFSERKALAKVLDSLNRGKNGTCIFATFEHRVIGVIDMAIGQPYLSEQGLVATCMGWYVLPDIRRTLLGGRTAGLLVREAIAWGRSAGATSMLVHGTHSHSSRMVRGKVLGSNVLVSLGE